MARAGSASKRQGPGRWPPGDPSGYLGRQPGATSQDRIGGLMFIAYDEDYLPFKATLEYVAEQDVTFCWKDNGHGWGCMSPTPCPRHPEKAAATGLSGA